MFRRRRFRGSSRSSGRRRKLNWTGGWFAGRNITLQNDGETVTFWAHWPAGLRNESGSGATEQELTSVDETLVKTIVSANMTLDLFGITQAQVNVIACLGFLAWDATTQSAGDLDGVVTPPGIVPHPILDHGADWLLRVPMAFTRDNFSIGNIAETFIVSRAMRKLPARTGILGVVGIEMPLDNSSDNATIDWTVDFRQLFKSGVFVGG